jgi:hypothetical protein
MADHDPTTADDAPESAGAKPKLPTIVDMLLGVNRAALADVPEGAIEAPAWKAAQSILAKFTPHEHQIQRWLVRGLAAEIMEETAPNPDEDL